MTSERDPTAQIDYRDVFRASQSRAPLPDDPAAPAALPGGIPSREGPSSGGLLDFVLHAGNKEAPVEEYHDRRHG